ncbi:mitochondrial ornithine carrier protein [Kwoniella heveanensis BCC8398]|uniref:Mitochondrial ornithine carrier protein n=1 Tax=Kwoniella heveanensis BCC8398 TaxID=1296120 RepID=A0A1B9GS21_9TREE|nr:mitochondrial ornithine carrier protein [Kwoniella heveanensis BCC8398]
MGAEQGQSNALEDITFGSAAGMIAKVFEHPFDLVKVRLQSQPTDRALTYKGPWDCFKKTSAKEGFFGLYRGLSAPLAGAAMENATLFVCYNKWKDLLLAINPDGGAGGVGVVSGKGKGKAREMTMGELAIAGGGAGFMASFVLTPIELVKCRMQVQMLTREGSISSAASPLSAKPDPGAHPFATTPHVAASASSSSARPVPSAPLPSVAASASMRPQGPFSLIGDIVRQNGLKGLWLGQTGTLFRETGGSAAWFAMYEYAARHFVSQHQTKINAGEESSKTADGIATKSDLKKWELMLSGAMAGVAYTVTLFPADSIKSAIQTQAELNPGVRPPSFAQMAKTIFRSRGFAGLYAGCGVTVCKSAPSSAIIFAIYETLESNFGGFLSR